MNGIIEDIEKGEETLGPVRKEQVKEKHI